MTRRQLRSYNSSWSSWAVAALVLPPVALLAGLLLGLAWGLPLKPPARSPQDRDSCLRKEVEPQSRPRSKPGGPMT